MTSFHVGTASWTYKDWNRSFYPPSLPAAGRLAYYARRFRAVEADTSFHGEPPPSRMRGWASSVPEDFRFGLKVPKQITHVRRLRDCAEDVQRFFGLVDLLGAHRGPVILQLPPSFRRGDLPDLFRLLEALPPRPGFTVELRHGSAFTPELTEKLRSHAVGLVTTDTHATLHLSGPEVVLRLLGRRDQAAHFDRVSIDRSADLERWSGELLALPAEVTDAWIFISNHFSGYAPTTAVELRQRLGLPAPPDDPGQQGQLFR